MAYKPAYVWNGSSFDSISGLVLSNLTDYALLNPSVTQTISNTNLSSPTISSPVITLATNAQIGTSYTLALSDRDKIVELNNGSPITLTVPTNATVAFPVGSSVTLLQTGAGQVTIGGAGVTINGTPGLKLRTQWASATLIKRATDTWVAIGDLAA
jgi:hypothetical protein